MTDVLFAIAYPPRREEEEEEKNARSTNVVFVAGLSDAERGFILENRAQLGHGAAKRAAVYTYSVWVMFRSLPIVIQLLVLIALIVAIINIPYIVMFCARAIQSDETSVRMIASLCASIVLIVTIVVLHLVT